MSKFKIAQEESFNQFPLWEVKVDNIPFDRELLENPELWTDNSWVDGKVMNYKPQRKDYKPGSSSIIDEWFNNFKTNNNILDLIIDNFEKSGNDRFFYREYPVEDKGITFRDFITKRCEVHFRIMRDEPGFKMNRHFDNRAVFGNIFFNLVENENVSTQFFNTFATGYKQVLNRETNVMYLAPNTKGEGVWFMNTPLMLHTVDNNTDQNRYVVNAVVLFPYLTHINDL